MNAPTVGRGGYCSDSYPQRITRSSCCCTIGAGWGQDPGRCAACPKNGTKEYEELCPGIATSYMIYTYIINGTLKKGLMYY